MANQQNTYKMGEIRKMISSEVDKQYRIKSLKERMEVLQNQLQKLEESALNEFVDTTGNQTTSNPGIMPSAAPGQDQTATQSATAEKGMAYNYEDAESIFDSRPGDTIIFNFQDVTIKAQRQLDDMFKIVDASESHKLKDGDYIKIRGNDILQRGRTFRFSIFREAGVTYQSNPLQGWKVIKNR